MNKGESQLKFIKFKAGDLVYRAEIDGLRAIAVLPVVFFHAGLPGFSAGFVGVDIFFVISGYLITSILLAEIGAGNFSFANFYERRARRILPALYVMSALCIPLAWSYSIPSAFKDFGQSLFAMVTFSSNFLFWLEDDYFAASAEIKPLLHTWSLSVEEQFYVLFPICLVLSTKIPKQLFAVLVLGVSAASILLSEFGHLSQWSATFWLLPFRAWELLIGCFAAILLARGIRFRGIAGSVLANSGLFLIAFSIIVFDEHTRTPSFWILLPTFGAALIVISEFNGTLTHRLLCSKPLVGTGLVSYSAYLYHQPVLAFFRQAFGPDLDVSAWLICLVLTACLSILSYRLIEQPYRNKTIVTRGWLVGSLLLCTSILGAAGLAIHSYDGFADRFPKNLSVQRGVEAPCFFRNLEPDHYNSLAVDACLQQSSSILIVGDSHAAALHDGFHNVLEDHGYNVTTVSVDGCFPIRGVSKPNDRSSCNSLRDWAFNTNFTQVEMMILSGRWRWSLEGGRYNNGEGGIERGSNGQVFPSGNEKSQDAVYETVASQLNYLSQKVRLVLVNQIPELGFHLIWEKARYPLLEHTHSYIEYQRQNMPVEALLNSISGADTIQTHLLVCDVGTERCATELDGNLLYTDSNHPSDYFSYIIAHEFLTSRLLQ